MSVEDGKSPSLPVRGRPSTELLGSSSIHLVQLEGQMEAIQQKMGDLLSQIQSEDGPYAAMKLLSVVTQTDDQPIHSDRALEEYVLVAINSKSLSGTVQPFWILIERLWSHV